MLRGRSGPSGLQGPVWRAPSNVAIQRQQTLRLHHFLCSAEKNTAQDEEDNGVISYSSSTLNIKHTAAEWSQPVIFDALAFT